jgi:hypothetical protein
VAHPAITTFARLAENAAKPVRSIAGQATKIVRSIHDMAYDPVKDEIFVMQTTMDAVQVFKGDANGDVAPLRMIMGPKTQIRTLNEAVGRLCLDTVNHELYLPNGPKVLVFDQNAVGDVAPKRVLLGPPPHDMEGGPGGGRRGLMYASTCTVDPVHNLLIISGRSPGWGKRLNVFDFVENPNQRNSLDGDDSVGQLLIFDRTAAGDASPLRIIRGGKTMLSYTQMLMTIYPPKGWIYAAVWGSNWAGTDQSSERALVGVFHISDNGNVAPRYTIGGPNGILRQARGVTLDVPHKTVIVSDKKLNGVFSFEFPELF